MASNHIAIRRLGAISYFEVGTERIEVKGYRVSTQADGKTQIDIQIECNADFTEFAMSATKESLQQQSLTTMNDVP